MNISHLEPLLRDGIVKGIDTVGQKFAGGEVTKENAVTRLLNRWNALEHDEKENVANVVIASAIVAVSAIGAIRGAKKTVRKNAVRAGKRVVKKVVKKVVT
jgi:hypothetical protein